MLIGGASLLGLSIIGLIVIPLCTRGPAEPVVGIERTEGALESAGPTLRVMTLNLAHGRADGVNQMLVSTNSIRDNLARVADFLTREAPDVVALQEADGPSFWSGRFDHVKTLAETARFGTFVRAENVKGFGLSYGTAVLSRAEVVAASGGPP